MKSPFPGVDPFLEDPTQWNSVHTRLLVAISDQLAGLFAPNFFIRIGERVHQTSLADPYQQPIAPEFYVVKRPATNIQTMAVSSIAEPTLIEPIYDLEIRDRYIEILDTQNREVVTTLELLSPFNKKSGTPETETFVRKRKAVMSSRVDDADRQS